MIDANGLPAKEVRGRVLDARVHLLDRQILNADGDPVGTVDDVEFDGAEYVPRSPQAPRPRGSRRC